MNPWDRLPNETERAYRAWLLYRDPLSGRNLSAVARKLQRSRQLVDRWARKYNWHTRAAAYDRERERIRQEAEQKTIVEIAAQSIKQQYELSPARTLKESAAIAFSHLGQAAEWRDGALVLKDSRDLPPEVLAAVRKVTVRKDKDGNVVQQSIEYHSKDEQLRNLGLHQRLWGDKETEAEVTQRNNFLIFINAMQSGELDHIVERITGAKLPPPPGKAVIEVAPSGPRRARD